MLPRPRLCYVVDRFVYTPPVYFLQPRFIGLCLLMCCRGCQRSFYPVFVLASGQRALLWWGKNAGHPPLTRQTSSAPHRCRPFYTQPKIFSPESGPIVSNRPIRSRDTKRGARSLDSRSKAGLNRARNPSSSNRYVADSTAGHV